MKFILGKKVNMTQYFSPEGKVIPVTVVESGPLVVTQVKTVEKDGYNALQVGFGVQKEKRISKPVLGNMKPSGGLFTVLREFRFGVDMPEAKVGDAMDLSAFAKGDTVRISGVSKGKGFQGVVKRHGFHGGPRSHGQKHSEREPGSIGGGLRTRVPKGMRMAGRTGGDTVTLKNVSVVDVLPEENKIIVKGAIPGRRGTLVKIVG